MIWVLVALAIAIFVDRVQLKLGENSYRSIYNGAGAITSVYNRSSDAPMAYRVLVPMIIGTIERFFPRIRSYRIPLLYEPIKIVSLFAVIYLMGVCFGYTAALLLVCLLPATFAFDYWDWTFEVLGVIGALSGNPYLFLVTAFLWALSKETAPLAPFIYLAVTYTSQGYNIALIGAIMVSLTMLAVRRIVGKREMYCSRIMFPVNVNDVRELFENVPFYSSEIFISILITLFGVVSFITNPSLEGLYVFPMIFAGWIMARAAETRVFTSVLVYVCITFSSRLLLSSV